MMMMDHYDLYPKLLNNYHYEYDQNPQEAIKTKIHAVFDSRQIEDFCVL
jgi:hypothetical protein